MTDLQVPPTLPARSSFPRKVIILFLLIIDTSIGIYFFFRWQPGIHLLVRQAFADLSLGLVAGAGARLLFRNRGWFVRFISAAAGLIVGMLALGVLTRWSTGLGPLYFWRTTVDWIGLSQVTVGMTSMILAMQAWSRPRQPAVSSPPERPENHGPVVPPDVHTHPRPKRKRSKHTAPTAAVPANPARIGLVGKPAVPKKRNTRLPNLPMAGLALRKPKVRLSKVEKHLCPYCLEPVERKDPRGVVECDICHTLHHGDCWAIAGACQVPHYTA